MNNTTTAASQWKKTGLLLTALMIALLLLQSTASLARAHKAQIVTNDPINNPPVAKDDDETITEDDTEVPIDVLDNDDGNELSITNITSPEHGTAELDEENEELIIYEPDENYHGTDQFEYTISDGSDEDTATVTITITPVNDAPKAEDDTVSTKEDEPVVIDVLDNDSDVENNKDELTITSVTTPSRGAATINRDGSQETITYKPDPNQNGPDTFDYTISDSNGAMVTATVTINITAENDKPEAKDDTKIINEDEPEPVDIDVLDNDSDIEDETNLLTIVDVSNPQSGTVTIGHNGARDIVKYKPAPNANGVFTFTYTISDTGDLTDTATVTVTVTDIDEFIFLPLLARPMQGDISFSSDRFHGLTSFVPEVTVDFSALNFGENKPDEMRLWLASESEPDNWIAYADEYTQPLDNSLDGAQEVQARFRYGSMETPLVSGTIFYVPNGDFEENNLSDWIVSQEDLPVSIDGGEVQLGNPNLDCVSMPFPAMAGLSIELQMPDSGDYVLHVSAIVYTYDQLPDPAEDTFDAFEVHLNDNISRYGNPDPGLDCATQRTVPVEASWNVQTNEPLELSLQNHSRFDNFYNTYTFVDEVWVEKR